MKIKNLLALGIVVVVLISSCKKDAPVQPQGNTIGPGLPSVVTSLATYNGNLFAFGGGQYVSPTYAEEWNGSQWNSISLPSTFVAAYAIYNGNLIVGGKYGLYQWSGSSWSAFGDSGVGTIYTMVIYNSMLVVAGQFYKASGNYVYSIAQWNGSRWTALGTGIKNSYPNGNDAGLIYSMCVYNGNLIVAGGFDSAGGIAVRNIAQWNGTTWAPLGWGIRSLFFGNSGGVEALTTYNGNLVAGGWFDSAGGQPTNNVAEWNGTTWSSMGANMYEIVSSFAVYNGNLIAGEGWNQSSAGFVQQWNGSSWNNPFGSFNANSNPVLPVNPYVQCLTVYNGNLIVGGNYNSVTSSGKQSTPLNNIAQWNGSSWSGL